MTKEQLNLYLEILEEKLRNEKDSWKAKALMAEIERYRKEKRNV